MKIDGLDPIDGRPLDRPGANKTVEGSSFGEILDGLAPSKDVKKESPAGSIPQMPFIQPPLSTNSNDPRLEVIGNIEGILTDLDMFGNALGNNDIPLDRLQPLALELVERKDDLASSLRSTPDEDLKNLISSTIELVIGQMNRYHTGYAA